MKSVIAEKKILYSLKGESHRNELTIKIGQPFIDDSLGEACCPVEWSALIKEHPNIYGSDTVHALHLATDVDGMLRVFKKKYDFFWPTGEPYFDE